MRSATPKHLHPMLGRRMVDWIARGRATSSAPSALVVVASPDTAAPSSRAAPSPCRTPALGHGRRRPNCARGLADLPARRRARPLRRHAAPDDDAAARRSSSAPRRAAAARRCSRSVPDDTAATAASSATRTGDVERSSRRADATPEQTRDRRGQLVDLRLPGRAALAGARPALSRSTPRASSISPTRSRSRRGGERVGASRRRDPARDGGRQHARRARGAAATLRDRINVAHMLAGVTIVDPATTWIEPTVSSRPTHRAPVHRAARRDEGRGGRRDRPARGRGRRRDRRGCDRGAVLLRSPRNGARRAREGRHVRGAQERPGRRRTPRFPISRYIGDAEIGAGTNVGAGSITANSPHRPGEPKKRR